MLIAPDIFKDDFLKYFNKNGLELGLTLEIQISI